MTHGSLGDEIGREVGRTLGYEFSDREIILRAANWFGQEVMELEHVTEEKPSLWERFSETAQRYITYVHAIIWEAAARDSMILSGRGAAFVLRAVPHALRVRITAPERIRAKRVEHQQGLTSKAAAHVVLQSDQKRAARIKFLYQVNWEDPCLYDLVLNTERLEVKEAARLIQEALQNGRFQPTPDSLSNVKDRSLTARAEATLLEHIITRRLQLSLTRTNGHLSIRGMVERDEFRKAVEEIVGKIPGITGVLSEIAVVPQHLIPE